MITPSTTNEVSKMSIINTVEWFHVNEKEIEWLKHYLVTDGDNVEIKWFDGYDWDSLLEHRSDINSEDITHFAELPYI